MCKNILQKASIKQFTYTQVKKARIRYKNVEVVMKEGREIDMFSLICRNLKKFHLCQYTLFCTYIKDTQVDVLHTLFCGRMILVRFNIQKSLPIFKVKNQHE
jgi:hypothetical protein